MNKNIYHICQGEGETIVLISGLGGQASFWGKAFKHLTGSYQVITFDHPGVGKSLLQGEPTIDIIAKSVVELLNNYDIPAAHIVGHSTGSLVAQCLALDYSERVKSIILSSGWAKPDQRFINFFNYRKKILLSMGEQKYNELTNYIAYPNDYYIENLCSLPDPISEVEKPTHNEMTLKRIDMLLGYTRLQDLSNIDKPCLVIGASDDFIIPFKHSEQLFQLIPNAKLVNLTGGHFTPKVKPAAYAELIQNFLGGLQ